jgi:hypothetical protein
MKNLKWMLIAVSAIFAIAAGATACDDAATDCTTDEDCDTEAGEVCDTDSGTCVVPCSADTDCDTEAGEICCALGSVAHCSLPEDCTDSGEGGSGGGSGGGGGGNDCGADQGVSDIDGLCHPTCTGNADCYSFVAYCANDSLCYDVSNGSAFNSCARVASAPDFEDGGPVVFDVTQNAIGQGVNCAKEPATCTNNGNVCEFAFQYYDPDGDIASTAAALYDKLKFINDAGAQVPTYNVPEISGTTIAFTVCYDESNTTPSGAIQLIDQAGNNSNAMCFDGSAP